MKGQVFLSAFLYQLAFGISSITLEPKVRKIYAFDNGTFIENLVVRENGHILFGTFNRGRMYDIDPKASLPIPQLVAELPGVNTVTGIAEVADGVFAVTASLTREGVPFDVQPPTLFTLSFHEKGTGSAQPPAVRRVAKFTNTGLLNGMCSLPGSPNVALSADSTNGTIFRLNTATGRKTAVIIDENLMPTTDVSKIPLGVNGIKIFGSFLYFTNSARGLFGRIPITKAGNQAGPAEIIARRSGDTGLLEVWDDFSIATGSGRGPHAYVGNHPSTITKIGLFDKKQTLFSSGENGTPIYGPTSVAVAKDQKKIYVVTAGNGGPGGQILEITIP